MGCTHSKNAKKFTATSATPPVAAATRVAHFDENRDQMIAARQSDASSAKLSRNMLAANINNNMEERVETQRKTPLRQLKTATLPQQELEEEKEGAEKREEKKEHGPGALPKSINLPPEPSEENPPEQQQPQHTPKYAQSAYYPFPEKMSPERKKAPPIINNTNLAVGQKTDDKKASRKKEIVNVRDNKTIQLAPTYRPLTQQDLEYIRRSVQQRNERRAYMMQHRNESDDTLYELEARMPEKDYTNARVL